MASGAIAGKPAPAGESINLLHHPLHKVPHLGHLRRMLRVRQVVRILAGHCMLPGDHQLAVCQLFLHQKPWQQRHATTHLGRTDTHIEGIKARPMVAVLGLVAEAGEPVVPALGARGILQQHQVAQLRGISERLGGQALWGAHRHQFLAEQLEALGARPRACAEVEGQVSLALQQFIRRLLVAQVQVDLRVAQAPALEPWYQPARAEGVGRGHPQYFGLAAVGAQVVGRHFHLAEDLAHFHQIQVARRSHLQAAAHPAKQQVLQQLFQLCDLLADGALREVQLLGGTGETQVAGHGLEALQGGDRGQMSFIEHGLPLFCFGMNKRNDISPNRRLLVSPGPATNKAWIAVLAAAQFLCGLKE